jgi:putative nucleotidyltransferase with HDIG domain
MDEYVSAAGNGAGGLDEYWSVIYAYPRLMGGAIWDFVSPGLREKARLLTDASKHGVRAAAMGRARLVDGRFGKGLDLNSHDQWVQVYRDPRLDVTGNQLTLSLWLFPRRFNGAGAILTKGGYEYGLQQTGKDSLEFYVNTARRESVRAAPPQDWEQHWHHLAGVYDGKTLALYVDGKAAATKACSGNMAVRPFAVNLGRCSDVDGQEVAGYLYDAIVDEAAVFDKAVSVDQLMGASAQLKEQAFLWLDFEEIKEAGEQATFDADIHGLAPELVKLLGRLKYRTSYGQNVLSHSLEVAHLAGLMAAELGANAKLAKRAGLLHDLGKAVDHEVEGSHAVIGANLARRYSESEAIVHVIEAHHNDVEPETVEAVLVAAADAVSGARPGARRETLETYVKRLERLEHIAESKKGVEKSYAIQAGREIRVMVKPEEVDDDMAALLCREIAKEIEQELEYPGQIRVTVIRESRAVEYAK